MWDSKPVGLTSDEMNFWGDNDTKVLWEWLMAQLIYGNDQCDTKLVCVVNDGVTK